MEPTGSEMHSVKRRLTQLVRMTKQSLTVRSSPASVDTSDRNPQYYTETAKPEYSEDVPYPLTREDAILFVKTKLNIPDPETLITEDRMTFLNRITERMNKTIPFTNIHQFTIPTLWEMDGPEMCKLMLSAEGGPCWVINPFTKALLEQFGYKTHHVCGHNPGDIICDTHIGTIVEDVSYPGSLHLVEPGTRRPLCEAIPLNFERESPEYKFHYLRSKFFRDDQDRLIWCVYAKTTKPGSQYTMYDSSGKAWSKQVIYFLKQRRNWHPFTRTTQAFQVATGGELPPPFNSLVFFAYLNEDQIISVLVRQDKKIVRYIYGPSDSLQRSQVSKSELLCLFQKYFPQYPHEKLQQVFATDQFN